MCHKKTQQLVDVSKDILELKQCIEMELHGEDYSWPNNDSNVRDFSFLGGLFFVLSNFNVLSGIYITLDHSIFYIITVFMFFRYILCHTIDMIWQTGVNAIHDQLQKFLRLQVKRNIGTTLMKKKNRMVQAGSKSNSASTTNYAVSSLTLNLRYFATSLLHTSNWERLVCLNISSVPHASCTSILHPKITHQTVCDKFNKNMD